MIAERERQAQARQEAVDGALRSTPVDLFTRRALNWVQTRQGAWVLSLGADHGTLRLRPDGEDTWQVIQLRREADLRLENHEIRPEVTAGKLEPVVAPLHAHAQVLRRVESEFLCHESDRITGLSVCRIVEASD